MFDGAQVKLGAGSHDELRVIALADGGGKVHEITSVTERFLRSVIAVEKKQRIGAVEQIT